MAPAIAAPAATTTRLRRKGGASMRATNYEELKDAISRRYPELPKQLQRIARYALERPDDLALATVAASAEAADVQPSSMIRFANALGFSGFSEMQRIFRDHLVERSSSYRERIVTMRRNSAGHGADGPAGVLHRFVTDAMSELGHLEENIAAASFQSAVRLIARADQIYVLAQRRAFPVACYMAYALSRLELRAHLLDGIGGMLEESARGIGRRDVLIAVSFRNYASAVIETALDCRRRGVAVIAITDSPLSPLKAAARIVFELRDDSNHPFRSLVGPLCLAQALVVSTGHHVEDAAAKRRSPQAA
jgi:DNA-binding MurR/RpiR family transcriptional regulator